MLSQRGVVLLLLYWVASLCVIFKAVEALETTDYEYVMENNADQLITNNTGTIVSHQGYLHQRPYPNNINSTLRIEVNGTLHVTLTVLDFELEDSYSCFDYLQVNDGTRYNCDDTLSDGAIESYFLLDGKFKLHFHTDRSTQKRGFRLRFNYTAVKALKTIGFEYVMEQDADQLLTNTTGTIISHQGYLDQSPYPRNVNSIMRIEVNGTLYVTLTVLDFDLEKSFSLCYDFLQVNDGIKYNCDGYMSNGEIKSYILPDGKFKLNFHTDDSTEKKGFRLRFNYTVIDPVTTSMSSPASAYFITDEAIVRTTRSAAIEATAATAIITELQTIGVQSTTQDITDGLAVTVRETPHISTLTPNLTDQNAVGSITQMQGENKSVELGAGFGVAALVVLLVVVIAVILVLKQRQDKANGIPNSGPTYGYANDTSTGNTLQVRMSALTSDPDGDNYYTLADTVGINNNSSDIHVQNVASNSTQADETDYDMAEHVETGGIYHLAGNAGTDNSEYTLAEAVTPNQPIGSAQVQSKEDEYQLADSTAEDYANIDSILRAEEEKANEEEYSSVLMATKTRKTDIDPGVTELVDNELYGS